jgi:anthraniloyl-CoA monooxygenase
MDEAESARFLEGVFAEDLQGHRLMINRSNWRRFPDQSAARWVKDNIVLLGDAKASAHFSIGSGTKLAMEDAIALHQAFMAGGDVPTCLIASRRAARGCREDAARGRCLAGLVRACEALLALPPDALRLRRDDALQGDHLGQPGAARAGVRGETQRSSPRRRGAKGAPASDAKPPMFQPFALRDMTLANRVVVSPMDMYSAEDGLPTTSTSSTTPRARWAAPGWSSPR